MCGKNRGRLKNKWQLVSNKQTHFMSKKKFFFLELGKCAAKYAAACYVLTFFKILGKKGKNTRPIAF